jgi:hypothetical protein
MDLRHFENRLAFQSISSRPQPERGCETKTAARSEPGGGFAFD